MNNEDIQKYLRVNSEVIINTDGSLSAEGTIEQEFLCDIQVGNILEYLESRKLKTMEILAGFDNFKKIQFWSCKVEAL